MEVAAKVSCGQQTVYDVVEKFITTGTVEDAPRSRHYKITNLDQDARIMEMTLENCWLAPTILLQKVLEDLGMNLSIKALHRHLVQGRIYQCVAVCKPLLREQHKAA
jgi:hypothetical protein